MPVIRFNQSYPKDLKAMTPPAFNDPDIINVVPENPGTEGAYDPQARTRTDLWTQKFLYLKDIDGANWWANAGKGLIVRRDGRPSPEGYSVEYGYPDKLDTARAFSIAGDGTADAINFDGSAAVALQLTNVSATKFKTARDFSISGDVVATAVSFDGQGNVILTASYNGIVPDNKLPVWIVNSFTAINNTLATLQTKVASEDTGVRALGATDANKYLRIVNSGTITVPAGVIPANSVIYIRAAAGPVTIAAGAGATVAVPFGQNNVMPGTGATVALMAVSSSYFELMGNTQYV